MHCGMDVRTFCGFSQGTTEMMPDSKVANPSPRNEPGIQTLSRSFEEVQSHIRRVVPFRSQGEPHENTPRPCVSFNLAPYRGRYVRRAGAKIPSHPGHNRRGAESGRYRGKAIS